MSDNIPSDHPPFDVRIRATFHDKSVGQTVWQPRFPDWYIHNHIWALNEQNHTKLIMTLIPREFWGADPIECYDIFQASPRYFGEGWPGLGDWPPFAPFGLRSGFLSRMSIFYCEETPDAEIMHQWGTDNEGLLYHRMKTPVGEVREAWKSGSTYPYERPLKRKEDFEPIKYIIEHTTWKFNAHSWKIWEQEVQGRTIPTTFFMRSPYAKCIVELAGTAPTMLLMKRYTKEFDAFCSFYENWVEKQVLPVYLNSPIEEINFPENMDCRNNPPPVYKKYNLPWLQKFAPIFQYAGKFTQCHFDGYLKDLLPYLSNDLYPCQGIEAPTFKPQGDVTIDEFYHALGDNIIVLDGLPSTIFLKQFSESFFEEYVVKVLKTFSPRLILGVSDEFSPNGLVSRMLKVPRILNKYSGSGAI
jgi:hypothetical protein